MVSLFKCIWGPRYYKKYSIGYEEGKTYSPNTVESCSDNVIRSLSFMWSLSIYTSPVIIAVLGKRGYFTVDGIVSFTKFFAAVGLILVSSLWLRGIGRWYNADYVNFMTDLLVAQANLNRFNKKNIMRYDFEFSAWPVDFRMCDIQGESKPHLYVDKADYPKSFLGYLFNLPGMIAGSLVAHTFGRRLVYPGTIGILQSAMGSMLLQGRTKLVEEHGAERVKLETIEKNTVDVMVVDRRTNTTFPNGHILVICTEGNAGFYEVGIMSTPLEAGYSVIGWNHPGFGGSTGAPFPKQETNAIDAVMQYAINVLKFQPTEIVMFAWSIGGYAATWAAMNYPEIRATILDATFDDLVPLALAKMPPSLKLLTRRTVRDHMNLHNAEQLIHYPGPILLIRRIRDEMITTDEMPNLQSNRANNLLIRLLKHRYPCLMNDHVLNVLQEWLIADKIKKESLLSYYRVDQENCTKIIAECFSGSTRVYPCLYGEGLQPEEKIKLAIFLAHTFMVDFDSTHCTPLPKQFFKLPWDPTHDNGFFRVNGDNIPSNI